MPGGQRAEQAFDRERNAPHFKKQTTTLIFIEDQIKDDKRERP